MWWDEKLRDYVWTLDGRTGRKGCRWLMTSFLVVIAYCAKDERRALFSGISQSSRIMTLRLGLVGSTQWLFGFVPSLVCRKKRLLTGSLVVYRWVWFQNHPSINMLWASGATLRFWSCHDNVTVFNRLVDCSFGAVYRWSHAAVPPMVLVVFSALILFLCLIVCEGKRMLYQPIHPTYKDANVKQYCF